MHTIHDTHAVNSRILGLIEELSAGCDADFDVAYDDLEREFSEIRLQHCNE